MRLKKLFPSVVALLLANPATAALPVPNVSGVTVLSAAKLESEVVIKAVSDMKATLTPVDDLSVNDVNKAGVKVAVLSVSTSVGYVSFSPLNPYNNPGGAGVCTKAVGVEGSKNGLNRTLEVCTNKGFASTGANFDNMPYYTLNNQGIGGSIDFYSGPSNVGKEIAPDAYKMTVDVVNYAM
ncbi:hypothetical protein [Aeromonas salmonicida]